MRGALSGFLRAAKNQNLFGGSQIKTEGTLKMEHKPDALIRRQITISGSLIDTRRGLYQKCEYDRGCITNKMIPPHTPEFSTTRSFPDVRGVEASRETASARFLKS
jgi:hypothetical protein